MTAVFPLVFLSQYFTLKWSPGLVEALKTLSTFYLSAQRPTKLPEQPLEDSFLGQGELLHFQNLQIYLLTLTRLPTPLSCSFFCDLLKDEMRWDPQSLSLWPNWGLQLLFLISVLNHKSFVPKGISEFSSVRLQDFEQNISKKSPNGYETAPLTYKSWDLSRPCENPGVQNWFLYETQS